LAFSAAALNIIDVGQSKVSDAFYPKVPTWDSNLFFGVVMLPFFVYYEFIAATVKPDLKRILLLNCAYLLTMLGNKYYDMAM
jgi:hypothetical protein